MYVRHPADRSCWRWVDERAEIRAMIPIRAEAWERAEAVTSADYEMPIPASDGTLIGDSVGNYGLWKAMRP
jgi:hypothetical protein